MTVLDPSTGFPSIGRQRCTLDCVEAEFVSAPKFAGSTTRRKVWEDFEAALELLKSAVKVHAVWLAGSFISAKLDPNDIDAVFVINARDLGRRAAADQQVVASFIDRVSTGSGTVAPKHGLKVDSFLLHWSPIPDLDLKNNANHMIYAANRGYWDDFWCRNRTGQKYHPSTWKDALPSRGYLEVMVNGYTR